MSKFSDLFKAYMAGVDMNPYRVAQATGMHEQYVYKICRGEQRPSDEVLRKFAAATGANIDTLKGWRCLDEYSADQIAIAFAASPYNPDNIVPADLRTAVPA